VLVTNGAMQALNVVFRTLLEPGDRVVIPSPSFFYGE
jgi:DNA-binding transcriptional MocR family regulator